MKKRLLATMLSLVLMLQVFSVTALANDIDITINLDNDAQSVTFEAEGLVAGSEVSLVGYYDGLEDDNIDYLNQYTADADGKIGATYLSRQEEWVDGDTIYVRVNGVLEEIKVDLGVIIIEDPDCVITYDASLKQVTATFTGLKPNAMYSFRAWYNEVEEFDFDYLDQYDSDSEGNLEVVYLSSQAVWENDAVIKVAINNYEFTEILADIPDVIIPVVTVDSAIDGVVTVSGSNFTAGEEIILNGFYGDDADAGCEDAVVVVEDDGTFVYVYDSAAVWEEGGMVYVVVTYGDGLEITSEAVEVEITPIEVVYVDEVKIITASPVYSVKVKTYGQFEVLTDGVTPTESGEWTVDNSSIVNIYEFGYFYAAKAGVAVVTVTYPSSATDYVSASITVRVLP